MTWFLMFTTGARLLEQSMMQRPGYPEYAARTSMFFPLPPGRSYPPGQTGRASDPAGMDVNANDVAAFLVEIGVLVLLAWAGFSVGGTPGWILGLGLPLVAAVLWGLFAAPRARVSSFWLQLVTKVVVLGAGVVAGFVVLHLFVAVLVAVLVVLNLVLMYVGPFARR